MNLPNIEDKADLENLLNISNYVTENKTVKIGSPSPDHEGFQKPLRDKINGMNGAARVDDKTYYDARVEDNDYFVAAPRYKSALDRYIKTAVATNDNLTEADVAKIVLNNTASKSAHSRTSQSSARVSKAI